MPTSTALAAANAVDIFDGVSLHSVNDDLFRNIVSLRASEDLFDDLSQDPAQRAVAQRCEMASKPANYSVEQGIIHRPFEEAAWVDAIQYPFIHWAQSRFSDGRFGVWYGAATLKTTVYETVYHWRHGLLADAGWEHLDGVGIERKVYRVHCRASLLDFRGAVAREPALVHPDDYSFTQEVGRRIHHEGHPGLVTRSARCDGDVFAVFNEKLLSNPRNYCFLSYRIDGAQTVVERSRGRVMLRVPAA